PRLPYAGRARPAGALPDDAPTRDRARHFVSADQLGGDQRAPRNAVPGRELVHRLVVRQLVAHGPRTGGEDPGPFGRIDLRELAETGQELRLVPRLLGRQLG